MTPHEAAVATEVSPPATPAPVRVPVMKKITLATKVTLLRVALIPLFMVCFLWNADQLRGDWLKVVATVVFIIAAITDYYDGMLARWYREETRIGKFIDPIADKLLVTSTLVLLVEQRNVTFVPGWAAVVIIAREFVVTGLRMIVAPRGKVIEVTNLAKWKTTAQLTWMITALVFVSAEVILCTYGVTGSAVDGFHQWRGPAITLLSWLAVIVTVWSGANYVRSNWHLVEDDAHN